MDKDSRSCLLMGIWNGLALYGIYILLTQLYWLIKYKWCLF
jgi:hypothetical protein